jgi:hypothetical protein
VSRGLVDRHERRMSIWDEAVDASRRVGRYEILREVGRGGMATVYVAQQLDLERRVALKELRVLGGDPSLARRFLREARLAGALSHPNIVTVHDYFEHEHVPYIAMEYLPRGALRPFIGTLNLPQVGGVLEGLLGGLAHAERHEVVHRDIKPENLLVTLDGGIKIADFGIAKATLAVEAGSMLTAIGSTVGTPNYIAPEQAMAQRLGPWTDLYSVGVTAFELLVGRPPFGDTREPMGIVLRQINEPLPRVSDLVPSVDPRLSDWVSWLAAKSPTDRPQTAVQARDALDEVLLYVLGPRWRRAAPLLSGAGYPSFAGESRTTAPAGRWGTVAGVGAGAAAGYLMATGVVAPPTTPTGAVRPGAEDALLAATLPPQRQVQEGLRPPGRTPWSRRIAIALKLASVAAILLVVGSAALSGRGGGGLPPAGEDRGQNRAQVAPTQAASVPAAPSLGTSAPPSSTAGTEGPLAEEVAPARQLAHTYEQAASRAGKHPAGTALTSSDVELVRALRETARSYRAASQAAARGDVAAYTAAILAAEASRQKASNLLDLSPSSGPSAAPRGRVTTPAAPPCEGDSVSDDPSDDACEN